MKRKTIFNALVMGGVGLCFAAGGAYLGMRQLEPAPAEAPAVANMFSQSLVDTSGQAQSLSQWKGKALVVNFWATWCAPCVDEMPELSALQTEVAPSNIQILGIGIDSSANIAQFASKYKITYPLYTGGLNATELSRQFGNKAGGLPFTVLVDRNGKVKKTYLGRLKMDELRKDLGSL
jgi:thiol-disulfide isomerase/thioredoxin